MTIKQTVSYPRIEVKARISTDLHRRMTDECGHCGCHLNGFIAIAIAHEIAARRKERSRAAEAYIEDIASTLEAEANAQDNS